MALGLDFSRYQLSYFTGGRVNALVNSLENTYGQFSFVITYLGSASGYLTKAMADNYVAAGLQIASVYEVTQRFENGVWVDYDPAVGNNRYISHALGYNYGYLDGQNAYNNAKNVVQQPSSSAIYSAVDGDVSTNGGYMHYGHLE